MLNSSNSCSYDNIHFVMIISKIILYVSTNDKLAHITYKQTNKFNKIYMLKKTAVGKMFVQESVVYSLMYRVQYFGNCEEELPKKPVGRLSADTLPTANRQATDSFPKKKIVEKTRIKHDIETIIISIDIT